MMIQKIFTIFVLMLTLFTNNAHGVNTQTEKLTDHPDLPDSHCYTIGEYQICPSQKAIKVYTMTGGVNWDGFTYTQLNNVDFDNTEMYIIGNSILFKEQVEGKDIHNAHFLHPQKYSLNHPGTPLIALDNDSIYFIGHMSFSSVMGIEDKKVLRDDIFIDREGKLFVLHKHNTGALLEIPASLEIDNESIRHLVDNYYYDKSKVYFFDYYSDREEGRHISRFAKTLGEYKNNNFRIGASYFTVDNRVYLRSDSAVMPLDLDVASVEEYLLDAHYMTYLITDGNTVYIHSKHYQGTEFREIASLRGLRLQGILSGASLWKYNSKSNLVYLSAPLKLPARDIKGWQGQLLISQMNNKVFIVDRDGKVLTLNGVMIGDDSQPLTDFSRLPGKKTISGTASLGGYSFSNEFYAALTAAFKEKGIDEDKVTRVGETVFHTDGKHLVLMDDIWQVNRTYGEDGHMRVNRYVNNWVCSINNSKNLKIINSNILTDGATLYYIGPNRMISRALVATPIADLGLPVFYLEKGKEKISVGRRTKMPT